MWSLWRLGVFFSIAGLVRLFVPEGNRGGLSQSIFLACLVGACLALVFWDTRTLGAVVLANYATTWSFVPIVGPTSITISFVCGLLVCFFAGIAALNAAKNGGAKGHPFLLIAMAMPVICIAVGLVVALFQLYRWKKNGAIWSST